MRSGQLLSLYGNSQPLLKLEKGAVLYVCGAGGKTTLVHLLAEHYRELGNRVLVTTTVHMMREEPLCTNFREAEAQLDSCGYAFAGRPDPKNEKKIIALPDEEYRKCAESADYVFVEADGARHRSVKVPYSHEPVIGKDASCIAVVYGAGAAGKTIRDAAYNPEGIVSILQGEQGSKEISEETLLTEELIESALEAAYLVKFREQLPGIPAFILRSTADKDSFSVEGGPL